MKKLGNRAILGAFALVALITLPCLGFPPDSGKPKSTGMMPSHPTMTKEMPRDTIPDSLKIPEPPFDSTLLTATFVVETRHKLYPKFYQLDSVVFGEAFPLGEEEEQTAKIIKFNPHLQIMMDGQKRQASDTLYNPAILVQVLQGDSVVQESWGFFFSGAPHFRASDYFGFKLVDFKVNEQKYIKPPVTQ